MTDFSPSSLCDNGKSDNMVKALLALPADAGWNDETKISLAIERRLRNRGAGRIGDESGGGHRAGALVNRLIAALRGSRTLQKLANPLARERSPRECSMWTA